MDAQLQQIRDQQRETWNRFSPGWKKWDELTMEFLKPAGDEIIRILNPSGSDMILDVAAGTGEPGLSIAGMLNGGKVMITDLAEGMLEVAAEKAANKGITNIETLVCDVSEMPFEDNTFDKISCRMGFMFFPDMDLAALEMTRVLKPGGKIATSVWDKPDKNYWVMATINAIDANIPHDPPPQGSPGLFRCADPGLMRKVLNQAGLVNVNIKEITGFMDMGTIDNYWEMMTEIAAPVVAALNQADSETREKVKNDVFASLNKLYPDGHVVYNTAMLIISAEKPA
jgi:ubiquinone/menaquinone biosynthesis C-methylase UbiE